MMRASVELQFSSGMDVRGLLLLPIENIIHNEVRIQSSYFITEKILKRSTRH